MTFLLPTAQVAFATTRSTSTGPREVRGSVKEGRCGCWENSSWHKTYLKHFQIHYPFSIFSYFCTSFRLINCNVTMPQEISWRNFNINIHLSTVKKSKGTTTIRIITKQPGFIPGFVGLISSETLLQSQRPSDEIPHWHQEMFTHLDRDVLQ